MRRVATILSTTLLLTVPAFPALADDVSAPTPTAPPADASPPPVDAAAAPEAPPTGDETVSAAQEETPAPPGSAEATAADLGGVATVGHTKAEASNDDASATGNALELGGNPPSEQFGGSAQGNEEVSGGLLDTGDTPLGRLRLFPWKAKSSVSSAQRAADAEAALLRLVLLNPDVLQLAVLASMSHAEHDGQTSSGRASSDGATVDLGGEGGLHLVVLHSEASSDGTGEAYLVGINGNKIFTSDQAGDQCTIELAPLLTLACLSVSGGEGSATAQVLTVVLGGEDGPKVDLFTTSGGGGGAPETTRVLGEVITPAIEAVETVAQAVAGGLAATGSELVRWALIGLLLAAVGGTVIVAGELRDRRARRLTAV